MPGALIEMSLCWWSLEEGIASQRVECRLRANLQGCEIFNDHYFVLLTSFLPLFKASLPLKSLSRSIKFAPVTPLRHVQIASRTSPLGTFFTFFDHPRSKLSLECPTWTQGGGRLITCELESYDLKTTSLLWFNRCFERLLARALSWLACFHYRSSCFPPLMFVVYFRPPLVPGPISQLARAAVTKGAQGCQSWDGGRFRVSKTPSLSWRPWEESQLEHQRTPICSCLGDRLSNRFHRQSHYCWNCKYLHFRPT